jgi:hypothetical protein
MSKKNPYAIKMDAETLQQYLAFRKHSHCKPAKKGKGVKYDRNKVKGVA